MIQLLFGRVRESEITRYIERKKKTKLQNHRLNLVQITKASIESIKRKGKRLQR